VNVWRFWWCQDVSNARVLQVKIQDQENKIRLSLLLLKESLIGWKGLASKHDFQNDYKKFLKYFIIAKIRVFPLVIDYQRHITIKAF